MCLLQNTTKVTTKKYAKDDQKLEDKNEDHCKDTKLKF